MGVALAHSDGDAVPEPAAFGVGPADEAAAALRLRPPSQIAWLTPSPNSASISPARSAARAAACVTKVLIATPGKNTRR